MSGSDGAQADIREDVATNWSLDDELASLYQGLLSNTSAKEIAASYFTAGMARGFAGMVSALAMICDIIVDADPVQNEFPEFTKDLMSLSPGDATTLKAYLKANTFNLAKFAMATMEARAQLRAEQDELSTPKE